MRIYARRLQLVALLFLFVGLCDSLVLLPACCNVGSYNEAATSLPGITITCTNCGATLTSLAVFNSLQTLTGTVYLSCTNCTSITQLGIFPALTVAANTALPAISIFCTNCPLLVTMGTFNSVTSIALTTVQSNNFSPHFMCSNCPSLTTIGAFPALTTLSSTSASSQTTLYMNFHVFCEGCVKLTTIANFANLATLSAHTISFNLLLSCDNCPKLVTLGNFPLITTLNAANSVGFSSVSFSPLFSCTDCYVLTTMGATNLASMTATSTTMCQLGFTPQYRCTNCGALLTLGTQASLNSITTCSHENSMFSISPEVSCTNCSALTSLGNFPNMPIASSMPRWYIQPGFHCADCPQLLTMASFPQLVTISGLNKQYQFEFSVNCTNCPKVTSVSPFSNLASLSGSNLEYGFSFAFVATCTNCNLVTSFADFPQLTTFMGGDPSPVEPHEFEVSARCTNCPTILQFGNFPKLTGVDQYGNFKALYSCTNCPALATMGTLGGTPSDFFLETQDNPYNLGLKSTSFEVQYSCTTCPSVTSFLDVSKVRLHSSGFGFPDNQLSPNMTITATCAGCTVLPSFGTFSAFTNNIGGNKLEASLTCTGCTGLTTMGIFSVYNIASDAEATIAPHLECVNCPKLSTLGSFPMLYSLGISRRTVFSPSFICNGCGNVTALGHFPLLGTIYELVQVGVEVTFTPTYTCTGCTVLTTMGSFPFASFLNLGFLTFAPEYQCVSCPALTTLASFPNIEILEVEAGSPSPAAMPFINFSPHASCETCPSLTSILEFPLLSQLISNCPACDQAYSSAKLRFAPQVECSGCTTLTMLSDFRNLSSVTSLAPTTVVTFAPYLLCVTCPALVTLLDFPRLQTLEARSDFDFLQYHSATCSFEVSGYCSDCGSVTRILSLPLLGSHSAFSSFTGASFYPWALDLECSNCGSLEQYADYQNLQGLGTSAVSSLRCTTCPLLRTFHPVIASATLDPNAISRAFTYTCSACPELTMEVPGVYVYRLNVPQNLTASPGVVVGLRFQNIDSDDFPVLGDSFSRLSSLEFNTISGMTNLDFLWRVRTIDGALLIANCADLEQIEGLRVNLRKVTDAMVLNNMVLCPARYAWLSEITTNLPVTSNNHFSPVDDCSPFEVRPALDFAASVDGNGHINLTWANPGKQQSVFVTYTLFMNNIPILSYPHANPISSTLITQTIPGATYLFTMTASLDGVTMSSDAALTVSIPTVLTGCPRGHHRVADVCVPCPEGTYQSGMVCIPCQKGFFSSQLGAHSATTCQPCAQGSYAGGQMSSGCLPCDGACPAGSIQSSPEETVAEGFTIAHYEKDGSLVEAGPGGMVSWAYLAAFGGSLAVVLVLAYPLKRWLKKGVSKVAVVLRTPFSILFVGPDATLLESPSYTRGLIGLGVLLGVALVTAYQIHVFAVDSRIDLTAVQPGTTFADGTPTTSTTARLRVNVTLLHSPLSCDPAAYSVAIVKLDDQRVTRQATVTCVPLSDTDTVVIGEFAEPVSFTMTSAILLNVTAVEGTAMFTHALSYALTADSFRERTAVMTETLLGDDLITSAEIDLSTVPSEYMVDDTLVSVGYTYTFTSSSVTTDPSPTQSTFTVTINMPSSNYFFQSRSVENISGLQFVAGVVALASGVITGGSILANIISHAVIHARRAKRKGDVPMEFAGSKENIL